MISFPNRSEGIPDWFEHQSRGPTISFWFRKEIPSITFIIILSEGGWVFDSRVHFFVNGHEIKIDIYYHVYWNHTTLFDMKLNELCKRQYEYDMEKGLLKNEWIHLELKLDDRGLNRLSQEEKNKNLGSVQMGIHVLMEKSNTEEENVVFTDPYLNYSNNTSLSQFMPPLKKKKIGGSGSFRDR